MAKVLVSFSSSFLRNDDSDIGYGCHAILSDDALRFLAVLTEYD